MTLYFVTANRTTELILVAARDAST